MKISEQKFGYLSNGKKVKLFTLKAGDLEFSLSNYGAAWTSLILPSRKNGRADVLLGYSGLDGYLNNIPFYGVTVGRFANRISGARFTVNGKESRLTANEGQNNLHSGPRGFDKCLWQAESYEENDGVYVRFELESPDGDSGFPGNMEAAVIYGLTKSNEIIAEYHAKVDEPCPVNLTNHAYYNLAGEGNGTILSHEFVFYSSSYVEIDKDLIPTGRLISVDGTPHDFRKCKKLSVDCEKINGYDHCFVVDGEPGKLRPCAEVYEPDSGRSMEVFTTQPAVQFYTSNKDIIFTGKHGSGYGKFSGFCLETQHYPDTPNHPNFPSCFAGPGLNYKEKAVFKFDW